MVPTRDPFALTSNCDVLESPPLLPRSEHMCVGVDGTFQAFGGLESNRHL